MRYLAILLLCGIAGAQTGTVSLTLTASTTPGVTKYNFYRSVTSGQYTTALGSALPAALKLDDVVPLKPVAQTFFYVARAVASDGTTESVNSNEVKAILPAYVVPNPGKMTCTVVITLPVQPGTTLTGSCQ